MYDGGLYLQAEQHRAMALREKKEEQAQQVDRLMDCYKKPLLAALIDLQSRLKGLIFADFLHTFLETRYKVGWCKVTQA